MHDSVCQKCGFKWMFAAIVVLAGAGMLPGAASADDKISGEPGFGKQFIRNHPFTLNAIINEPIDDWVGSNASFVDLGVNTVMAWRVRAKETAEYAHDNGLSWLVEEKPLTDLPVERVNQLAQIPNGLGFVIGDEPSRMGQDNMDRLGSKIEELRAAQPDYLYMTNAYPNYASQAQLWGNNNAPAGYDYEQYLEDIDEIIDPDVRMYDHYPFRDNNRRDPRYFANLMSVREAAQSANKPYWQMVQAFENRSWRVPSESDLRMQSFSSLTAGYTGLTYYFYNPPGGESSIGLVELNENNEPVPTAIYTSAKQMYPEIENLGKSLRFLESTVVRFVPGQSASGDTHDAPPGLIDFRRGAGSDPHIASIQVLEDGPAKDGLIGLFTDDDGEHYFMLTNIYHGGNLTAEAAALEFEIVFDEGEVDEILRLSRETGEQEVLEVTDDTLYVTLPGGTGDLFKYDTGDFVTHMPEPTSLGLLGLGGILMLSRRGPRVGERGRCVHGWTSRGGQP